MVYDKVEVLKAYDEDNLQMLINNFINNGKLTKVINIKYSSTVNLNTVIYSALIHYM